MKIYSLGFTKKKASEFFGLVRKNDVARVVDVRLNNVSQLAGFAKKDDLKFFLKELCGVDYVHLPDLAPTKIILDRYKKKEIDWHSYENEFNNLMVTRNVERIDQSDLEDSCLLCSEHLPHHCHRRLVIEYLNECWDANMKVHHLY